MDVKYEALRSHCGREFTCILDEPSQGHFIVPGSEQWRIENPMPPNDVQS